MQHDEKTLPIWKRFTQKIGTAFYHFCLEWSDSPETDHAEPKKVEKPRSSPKKQLLEKDKLGIRGENEAVAFLKKNGYEIKARNVEFVNGEIDIIAQIENCVVFVEVKTRHTAEIGGQPYEAVKAAKRRRIVTLAEMYIQRFLSHRTDLVYRFDIISIVWPENSEPTITHIENAFDASEKYPVCPGRKR